jgi:hypothetical protein
MRSTGTRPVPAAIFRILFMGGFVASMGSACGGDPGHAPGEASGMDGAASYASGGVLVHAPWPDAESVGCLVVPEEAWTVVPGPEPEDGGFFGVGGVVVSGSGSLWVLEPGAFRVHRLADGAFLSTGRRGDGPGEFRRPQRLIALPGDSVAVWDAQLRRISVIGPDAVHAREISLHPDLPRSGIPPVPLAPVAWMPEGGWTARSVRTPAEAGRIRDTVTYYALSPDAGGGRELFTVPGTETWVEESMTDQVRNRVLYPVPFGVTHVFGGISGGRLVLGGITSDRLELRDPGSGAVLETWVAGNPDGVVDEAALRSNRERLGRLLDPAFAERMGEIAARTTAGSPHGGLGTLLVEPSGAVWIGSYVTPPGFSSLWRILEKDGRDRSLVSLPERMHLHAVGDAWLVATRTTPEGLTELLRADLAAVVEARGCGAP